MNFQEHKAMLAAHEAGTATPEQQRAMHAHLLNIRRQHHPDRGGDPARMAEINAAQEAGLQKRFM
jgi:hypothetical protein